MLPPRQVDFLPPPGEGLYEAGQRPVGAKLSEVAADLEAQVVALERKRASGVDLTGSRARC
jgi:hypothetical protein